MSKEFGSPNEQIIVDSFTIIPDTNTPWGNLMNALLEKGGRTERFRQIKVEDGIVAEGIWTQEEAREIAKQIYCGSDSKNGGYRARYEDYEEVGDIEDTTETFTSNREAIEAITGNGLFIRNGQINGRYNINYPPQYAKCGINVHLSVKNIEGNPKKTRVTLHFMI